MSFFSRKKKHSENPSTPDSVPVSGLASSQLQPVHPWSAHVPPIGKSPSPFPRDGFTLSISVSAGEMFLFGGCVQNSSTHHRLTNNLFVISTRNFSTALLQTSGDIPSPRHGHRAILTTIGLLIWGGYHDKVLDDLYRFNLVLRKWTRIVVNGPGPGGRSYHTMTLTGSKLFIFGGLSSDRRLNDIWALDLNRLKSNPFWESYEPAPGNKKPHPRSYHVSVTSGNHIIIFGGYGGLNASNYTWLNDTWSFNILTRKWTELQCTGSIPSPRAGHAAVLIGNLMYVFGGSSVSIAYLGDLCAFNLSTQLWIAFQDIGPGPSKRCYHSMVCDGTRIFALGGSLPQDEQDETKPFHVLDTKLLSCPEPDSNVINPSKKTTKLVQKSSASPPTRGQPHQPSSSSGAHAALRATSSQTASSEEPDRPAHQQVTREQNPSLNSSPSRPTGASGRPRRISGDSEGSADHDAKRVAPDSPSGKEIGQLENGHLVEFERQLSETLVTQTERDRRIGQLIDELALKSAHAAEEKKRTGQELSELQTKLDESQLSRDHALEQAWQAEASAAEEKRRAALELQKLQAKLDGLILSRDEYLHMLEQAQSALQEATSRAADADARSQPACEHETELAGLRAELEEKKSELASIRLRLTEAEDGWAKSKAKAGKLHTVTAANLVDLNEDQTLCEVTEDMQVMGGDLASLKWNEKSMEEMACGNEG